MFRYVRTAAAAAAVLVAASTQAQIVDSTEFTYQGRLDLNGAPFDGNIDSIQFRLWDGIVGGNLIGGPISLSNLPAEDGLFTVDLDFGAEALAGPAYLEISLLAGGQFGTTLSPRQLIRPAPKAIQAAGAKVEEGRRVVLHRPPGFSGDVLVDQGVSVAFNSDPSGRIWQSFTAPREGELRVVSYEVIPPNAFPSAIRFYEGEGTSGALLKSSGWGTFRPTTGVIGRAGLTVSSGVVPMLEAGKVYTFEIEWPDCLFGTANGTYSGGRSSLAANNDMNFRVESRGEGTSRAYVEPDGDLVARNLYVTDDDEVAFGDLGIRASNPTIVLENRDDSFQNASIQVDHLDAAGAVEVEWDFFMQGDEFLLRSDTPGLGEKRRLTFEADTPFTGINVFNPYAPLHVVWEDINVPTSALNTDTLILEAEDSVLGLYSNQVASYGSAIALGAINSSGQLVDKWGIVRETATAGNDLQFRWGPSANYAANPLKFEVRDTGDIWSQGQLFQNSSGKLKDDVEDIRGAVDTLLELRGVRYTWKDDGDADIGFIAEEMAEALPEIVDFDEQGEPAGIDYGRVTALLVEAVKEQQAAAEKRDSMLAEILGRLEQVESALSER